MPFICRPPFSLAPDPLDPQVSLNRAAVMNKPGLQNEEGNYLREGAQQALRNARSLLSDAELLHANGRCPRALSIAILGQEEVGKALYLSVAALDLLTGARGADFGLLRDHAFKQALQRTVPVVVGIENRGGTEQERTLHLLEATAAYVQQRLCQLEAAP